MSDDFKIPVPMSAMYVIMTAAMYAEDNFPEFYKWMQETPGAKPILEPESKMHEQLTQINEIIGVMMVLATERDKLITERYFPM